MRRNKIPITGVNSYPETVELFADHWRQVAPTFMPDGLVLPDGTMHADFVATQSNMNAQFDYMHDGGLTQRQQAAALLPAREKLQPRFAQAAGEYSARPGGHKFVERRHRQSRFPLASIHLRAD